MDTPATIHPLVLGTDEELRWRLSHVTPTDFVKGVVFNGLRDVVRKMEGEAAVQRCLEACEETYFLDFFEYSYDTFLRMLYTAGRLLGDKCGGFDKALWWIAYEGAKALYATSAGRVLVLMAQGDPRRLLNNVPVSTQLVSSNRECKVLLPGPKRGVLLKHDLLPREYVEGGFVALFHAAKVKGVQVCSRSLGPTENEYEFTWE
jgi:uncharacterized protein (TIGR02265 family)